MESEFPLYPFLVSRLYGLMGVQEWLGRGLSVLFSALTIWLVMRLGRRWFTPQVGWWAGMAFALAPVGGLLRKDVSGRSLISAVRRGITRSPQHLC